RGSASSTPPSWCGGCRDWSSGPGAGVVSIHKAVAAVAEDGLDMDPALAACVQLGLQGPHPVSPPALHCADCETEQLAGSLEPGADSDGLVDEPQGHRSLVGSVSSSSSPQIAAA